MKTQAVIVGRDSIARLADMDLPEMTDSRVRLRTLVSGVSCGTEADSTSGRALYMSRPFLSGYQSVAKVVDVGNRVENLNVGDTVFTTGGGLWNMTHLYGGSHARECVVEQNAAVKLQSGAELFATASYATLGAVGHESIARMKLVPGEVLIVFGLGMLGQLAGKIAQLLGMRVLGVNRSPEKRKAAAAFGFDAVCPMDAQAIRSALKDLAFGPPRFAMETTGRQEVFDLAICSLAAFSELSLAGYYPPGKYSVDWDVCHKLNLSIHNPVGYGGHIPDFIRFVDDGRLNAESLIRHRVKPDEVTAFYTDLVGNHGQYLGVVIDWQ